MKKLFGILCACIVCGILLAGCNPTQSAKAQNREMDYTVVPQREIPEQLKEVIEERKQEELQMTFLTENALYIVCGYGEQASGGYSIQVEHLMMGEDAIYLKTNLLEPQDDVQKPNTKSYPYIVIKTEKTEDVVVFE